MSTGRSGPEMQKLIEIDGQSYLIQHPSPSRAWELGIELMKIVGEPFAAMAQVGGKGGEDKVGEVLPMAVKALMTNLKPQETLKLIKEVLLNVEIQGQQKQLITSSVFDLHFRGQTGHMLKVFTAAVEFQFSDFFGAIGDAIADVFQKAKGGRE